MPNSFKMDVLAENGVPFRVVFLPFGDSENYPAAKSDVPVVEFYDLRYDFTPDGQFTGGRYRLDTIMEGNPFSGLVLDTGSPNWRIDGDTMHIIRKWLNSFEVLPAS
jgi:hypothetical protein